MRARFPDLRIRDRSSRTGEVCDASAVYRTSCGCRKRLRLQAGEEFPECRRCLRVCFWSWNQA